MKFSPVKPWHIYLLSALALLILAVFSVGYYHPDEHFQILEFAGLKLNLTKPEYLPWEFHARMRPAFQPAMVVVVHKVFALFGNSDPFTITMFLRMLSGALSFVSMWMIYKCYSTKINDSILQKWFLGLSFLLWFALYNNVRFSSETWSGSLFIIGFSYLFFRSRQPMKTDFLITGILLGLSFIIRFQTGFLVAGFLAWFAFIRKERFINIGYMIAGIFLPVIAGIITDYWFYGEWTLTAWNYFQQNILADKISGFGINPWYFYVEDVFVRAGPPLGIVIILAFILVFIFRPKDLLTWTLLPFIAIHCLIGHKETRFFYPLIGFIPIFIIKATEIVRDKWSSKLLENKYFLGYAKFFWICNEIMIILVFFIPADSQVKIYETIYRNYHNPITLYYFKEDPYARALDIYYYKRKNLNIKKAESTNLLNADTSAVFLIAVKTGDKEIDKIKNKRLICSSFPEWLKKFNFNQWVERTTFWDVYEVDNL